jgi:hypothetical protein
MAFTATTGTFKNATGILSLINEATKKKKAAAATAVTTPANVYTPDSSRAVTTAEDQAVVTAPEEGTQNVTSWDPTKELPEQNSSDMPAAPATITPETHYISDDPTSPYYWETLGYADATWVGLPYDYGYWQDQTDGTKLWVQQRDMKPVAQQMHDLANTPIPVRPDLIDLTTSAPMAGIQGLIDIWNDPNTAIADRDAAVAQFASEMGMSTDELTAMLNGMLNQSDLGVQGQTGLTEEYQDAYNRQTALELQDMKNNYKMMIEAMSAQGRDVAGFTAMDTIANEMSTYQLTRDIELMNMDMAAKQAEFDANLQTWQTLYEQKEMTAQQLIDNIQTNRMNALTGYAQEMAALVSQNQLTLEAYSADLEATSLHAEIVYKSIMADMGVAESMMSQLADSYEMYMAPYYAELERWSLQQQVDQADQAGWNTLAAGMMTAGGLMLTNPVTFVPGLLVIGFGAIVGIANNSVICTELHNQGLMTDAEYEDESTFGSIIINRRPDVYAGYRKLADPIVRYMKKHPLFSRFIAVIVRRWTKEMRFLMGRSKRGSLVGKLINEIGFRLCAKISEVKHA